MAMKTKKMSVWLSENSDAISKEIAAVSQVSALTAAQNILCEADGSVRRITVENLIEAIKTDQLDLSLVAWGVPIKQNQDSQSWGRIGNLTLWEEYKRSIGRYLVKTGGEKMAKLSASDSSIFADGTTVDESKGDVFVVAPRLYFVVKYDASLGCDVVWMSQKPIGGYYIEHPMIGAYMGCVEGGALHSRSSKNIYTTSDKTIRDFWNAARANGNDYGITCYEHGQWGMMANLSEYGNPNVQANIGNGIGGEGEWGDNWSEASQLKTGATISLGDNCGSIPITLTNAPNACRVSLFGIEDWYNWQWEYRQGIYFGSSNNSGQTGLETFIYEGNRLPTDSELTSHPTGTYRTIQRQGSSETWVAKMTIGEYFDLIPSEGGGGSNSRWGDKYWCYDSNSKPTGQLCVCGGSSDFQSRGGLGCVSSHDAFGYRWPNLGARLAYYGALPKIVNGADL